MQPQDYAYLYELEDSFWWFAGMRAITSALLDPIVAERGELRILDAGCGTGGMLSWMQRYTSAANIFGVDFSTIALEFCHSRNQKQVTRGSIAQLPFVDAGFDLVTSFDVLQHLNDEDDARAIGEFYRVLRPGGIALVRVAAYNWLRSAHDDAIAVQRRYTLTELTQHFRRAGFNVRRATYANTLLFPIAAIKRLVFTPAGKAHAESEVKPWRNGLKWMNGLMTAPLQIEAQTIKHFDLPFGVSAICIGEKPVHQH
ncbi:MAG TPA: class I SAM-dependent methyltransferase [Pyrinomonadaceae bacterium]|jgi:SAM-dependent methyltransferase|nr:class I SAM-dependent methyltransferase [Pyrinomonadaceae bacterium]